MSSLEDIYLEKAIIERCARIDCYAKEIVETDRDVQHFIADYCERVEPFLTELKKLDNTLRRLRLSSAAPTHKTNTASAAQPTITLPSQNITQPRHKNYSLYGELRKLYRSLAKDYHPDVQTVDDGVIKTLNLAYKNKQLGSLWHIAFSQVLQESSAEKQAQSILTFYNQKTKHALHVVQVHLRNLHLSSDYKLKERYHYATLAGDNFIETIIASLQEEIHTKQRRATYLELTTPLREYKREVASWS